MVHLLVVDMLEQQTLLSLKESLQQASSLLALHRRPASILQLGLCAIWRRTPENIQLQVATVCVILFRHLTGGHDQCVDV